MLTSLVLETGKNACPSLKPLFQGSLSTIKSLTLHGVDEKSYQNICSAMNDGKLSSLTDLSFSMIDTACSESRMFFKE